MFHLGVEGSCPPGATQVDVMPHALWQEMFGHPGSRFYNTETTGKYAPYYEQYTRNVRAAIEARVSRPWEAIVCAVWGGVQERAVENLPQFAVESGIGYKHTWAKYRVFESYAWMHFHFGLEQRFDGNRWYDVVIPGYVDPAMFDFRPHEKQDYFLFMGRLNDDKGVGIAVDVARRVGRRLKIAGQGDPTRFLKDNPHVEYVPPVNVEGRRQLMAEAAAFFCPTQYVEPFGNVAIEAQASGTPVICTDWGAFTETVVHGITGYRCRTLDHFLWAARNYTNIDPAACRRWVIENYGLDRIAQMYEEYFQMLLDLNGPGWNAERDNRTQLDWLTKRWPGSG